MAKEILTVKQIKDALTATGGFVSSAAVKLNCNPSTLYANYFKKYPGLETHLKDIREEYLDLAESELIKKVRTGDLGAICFYLKCQGKQRGWIERQEITGKDGDKFETGIVILPAVLPVVINK